MDKWRLERKKTEPEKTGDELETTPNSTAKLSTMDSPSIAAEIADSNPSKLADSTVSPGDADFKQSVLLSLSQIIDGQKELRRDLEIFKREITQTVEFQAEEILELQSNVQKLDEASSELKTYCNNNSDTGVQNRQMISDVSDHVNRVERATRRNNIRIIGYPETDYEDIKEITRGVFSKFDFATEVEIERAHRDGKRHGRRTRHILVKLLRFTDKVNILKSSRQTLQNESYRIVEDLTKIDLDEKQKWKEEVSELYEAGKKLRFVGGVWRDREGKAAPFYEQGGCTFPRSAVTTVRGYPMQ